jgi:Protein of unknown function (DUF3301)
MGIGKSTPGFRRREFITVNFWQTLLVVGAILGGWLMYEALRAREAAIRVTKEACRQQGLQLLDDTVHGVRLRFVRDQEGVVRLRRTFLFDFSEDGFNRRSGSVVMLGAKVESLQLEPYRVS